MSATAPAMSTATAPATSFWLRTRPWDLRYISLSVILVAVPYTVYLLLLNLGFLEPIAAASGTTVESISRNFVNISVALVVGGPHMYATWTRTYLDRDFAQKNRLYVYGSGIIPLIVIGLALFNLPLLLTVFFFWASIHVLHQIIYITNLYNEKQPAAMARLSRFADYAVILTALYPLAAYKIANNMFLIGENNLSEVVASIIPVGNWMVWLAGLAFGISLLLWIGKSIWEWRRGILHKPKTVFIAATVTASFIVPALGNLDTAFQGMNVWHSFQYLALTWMLNHLRQQRGELKDSPFVERLSDSNHSARRFYLFTIALTGATIVLAAVIFGILYVASSQSFDYAFDRAYYIAVLSFLWIHYYFDHFLFVHPEVIVKPGVI